MLTEAPDKFPSSAAFDAISEALSSEKDKKVPNDKRTTTPYMTKYEKARVLGTRALQIRYAQHSGRIKQQQD